MTGLKFTVLSFSSHICLCNPYPITIQNTAITPQISVSSIHVNPFHLPPYPTPQAATALIFFFFLPQIGIAYFRTSHKRNQYGSFCTWLLLVNTMILRPVLVLCISEIIFFFYYFLLMSRIPLYGRIHFVYSFSY